MDSIEEFNVTLLSNSCLNLFPKNKTSEFQVKLNRPLFMENFKVALTSAIFSNKFNNITPGNSKVVFGPKVTPGIPPVLSTHVKATIPKKNYKSIDELIAAINENVEGVSNLGIKILLLDSGRVKVNEVFIEKLKLFAGATSTVEPIIVFENKLATVLGFPPNVNIINKTSSAYNLDAGIPHEIFIYSNIIEHQIISDTSAPLLKILPISSNNGEKNHVELINRDYLNVFGNQIDTIKIECRDAQKNLIAFEDGNGLILKLHFKRYKSDTHRENSAFLRY